MNDPHFAKPPTALLVEDNVPLRSLMYRLLTGYGFDVRMAEDADEALTALGVKPADVVIADIRLPGMNGCRLIREIVARYPGTRCLLTSGYFNDHLNENRDCERTMPLLAKPFTADMLFDLLTKVQLDAPWRPKQRDAS